MTSIIRRYRHHFRFLLQLLTLLLVMSTPCLPLTLRRAVLHTPTLGALLLPWVQTPRPITNSHDAGGDGDNDGEEEEEEEEDLEGELWMESRSNTPMTDHVCRRQTVDRGKPAEELMGTNVTTTYTKTCPEAHARVWGGQQVAAVDNSCAI
eukprot:TRINITY_DN584_c0_g1_i2.p1 TRINITY_DN584_c0_g1~~TRINITY_DN584_c0_g1_i2.p1  ORF type:complete len:164 (+),score=17.12 TRINITY_DN584_c0_g1_i2:40-492(+)